MTEEDIFGETPIAEEQAAPETVTPEPVVEAAEPAIEPPVATPEPAKPEAGFVPLAALLDERDRKKQLEQELARFQAQQAPVPEQIDPWEDLNGALTQQEQKMQLMLYQQQLAMSERFARQAHGDDVVEKAKEWGLQRCAGDQYFNAQVMQSGDPVGYAVEQYKRDQIASQVNMTEFEQFKAWQAAQSAVTQQTAAPAANVNSVQPPPSLASVPSAGSSTQPKPDPVAERLNSMF